MVGDGAGRSLLGGAYSLAAGNGLSPVLEQLDNLVDNLAELGRGEDGVVGLGRHGGCLLVGKLTREAAEDLYF